MCLARIVLLSTAMLVAACGFAPGVAGAAFDLDDFNFATSPTTRSAAADAETSVEVSGSAGEPIRDLRLSLPSGMTYDTSAAAARCGDLQLLFDRCPAASRVGSLSASLALNRLLGESPLGPAGGSIYALTPANTLAAVIRPSGYGRLVMRAAVSVSGGVTSLSFTNMPRTVSILGLFPVGARFTSLGFSLSATTTPVGPRPLLINPPTCAAGSAGARAVSYRNSTVTRTAAFAATGCDVSPPDIAITSPADGSATSSPTAVLTYTASDDTDPSPACSPASGSSLSLAEGVNTFVVTCVDASGKLATATTSVTYVPPAATVELAGGELSISDDSPSSASVDNHLTITTEGGDFVFRDPTTPLEAPAGCSQVSTSEFRCGQAAVKRLAVNSGPGDDVVVVASAVDADIYGGDGDDHLTADLADRIYGQGGDDVLTAGPGDDYLFGGAGDDQLYGEDGRDMLVGEAGSDWFDGGDAPDTYAARDGEVDGGTCDAANDEITADVPEDEWDGCSTPTDMPQTVITDGPRPGEAVSTDSVEISFTAFPAATGVPSCQIDNDGFPPGSGPVTPCTSPFTTPALSDGPHTVYVVYAEAGTDPTLQSNWTAKADALAFTVDTTGPAIAVTAPSGPIVDPTPTISGTTDQPVGASVDVDVKNSGNSAGGCSASVVAGSPNTWSCSVTSTLPDGDYSIEASTADGAGNSSTGAGSFTLDTTNPVVAISSPTDLQLVTLANPEVVFTSSDASSHTERCQIDSGSFTPCTSPWTTPALGDGDHTVTVRSTDAAGNVGQASVTFNVDVPSPPVAAATILSAGDRFTCAVDGAGAAKCWGANGTMGNLGDGSTTSSSQPIQVVGLTADVTAIGAGSYHSCAVVAGAAKCWGTNWEGNLGDGTTTTSLTPVQVSGLTDGVTAISASYSHTCAIVYGAAKCWGRNWSGQLGDGSTTSSVTPVQVAGLTAGVTAISTGGDHTCAIVYGAAKCWGANSAGKLGNDDSASSSVPVQVSGLTSGVTAISAGLSHSCAVVNGAAKCWGYNGAGKLGDGTTVDAATPAQVVGLASGVTAIAAGATFSCAAVSGAAKCWGANPNGELGDGTTAGSTTPVQVDGLISGVTSVSASDHGCALVSGVARCWGRNSAGQVGDGTSGVSSIPVEVSNLTGAATEISAGSDHSCALAAGAASCWGDGDDGQLGDGTRSYASTPIEPQGMGAGVTAVSAGYNATCAAVGGAAKCWGSNMMGKLGDGSTTDSDTPVDVFGLGSGVTDISAGDYHACAVVTGAAKCWGYSGAGTLGDGTTNSSSVPVDVVGLSSGVSEISAGYQHSCAVVNGAAKCWGINNSGELGDGTTNSSTTPVQVAGLTSGVTAISVGHYHTCAIVSGAAKCWGDNSNGMLGDGTTVNSLTPVEVSTLTAGVTAISAGANYSCAVVNGAAKCWGNNGYGQLGDGTHDPTSTPVQVQGLVAGVTAVSARSSHTCAIASGVGSCWGNGEDGQLGDGGAWKSRPSTVVGFTPAVSDTTPPALAITAPSESAVISIPDVGIDFTATDMSPHEEWCKVDSGSFTPCTSQWTTPALGDGDHTVTVRSTDAAGNVGQASVSFTVSLPAQAQIDSAPDVATGSTSQTFEFSAVGSPPGTTFECRLDGQPWAACSSPHQTSTSGARLDHVFGVRAIKGGTVTGPEVSRHFLVDSAAFGVSTTPVRDSTIAAQSAGLTLTQSFTGGVAAASSQVTLPKGMHVAPAAFPSATRCQVSDAAAGVCAPSTSSGPASIDLHSPAGPVTLSGDTYIVDSQSPDDVVSIYLIFDLDGEKIVLAGRLQMTNNATNDVIVFDSLPTATLAGTPLYIASFTLGFSDRTTPDGWGSVINASACSIPALAVGTKAQFDVSATSVAPVSNAAASTAAAATGCNVSTPPYAPTFSETLSNPVPGETTGLTLNLSFPGGSGTNRQLVVTQPAKLSYNVPAGGSTMDQCASGAIPPGVPNAGASQFDASSCPPQAKIGTIALASPLWETELTGDVYLVRRSPLPLLGIEFNSGLVGAGPSGYNASVAGIHTLYSDPSCDDQVEVCFDRMRFDFRSLPDIPYTSLTATFTEPERFGDDGPIPGELLQIAPPGDPSCEGISDPEAPQTATTLFVPWASPQPSKTVNAPVITPGC